MTMTHASNRIVLTDERVVSMNRTTLVLAT